MITEELVTLLRFFGCLVSKIISLSTLCYDVLGNEMHYPAAVQTLQISEFRGNWLILYRSAQKPCVRPTGPLHMNLGQFDLERDITPISRTYAAFFPGMIIVILGPMNCSTKQAADTTTLWSEK